MLFSPIAKLRAQWELLDAGTTTKLEAVYAIDSLTVLIAGKDGLLKRSIDAGETWTDPFTGFFDDINAFAFSGPDTGYAAADDGVVLKTTDGGVSWSMLSTGGGSENLDILLGPGNLVAVSGENGSLYRSTDGGLSWTPESSGSFNDLNGRARSAAGLEIAVGDNGTLSRLAGSSWSSMIDAPLLDLNAVVFNATEEAFAAGDNGRFLHSVDGGVLWTAMPSLGFDLDAIALVDNNRIYVCGDNGNIYWTNDAGLSWTPTTTPISDELEDVYFSDPYHGFAVGNNGRVLRWWSADSVGSVDTVVVDTTLSGWLTVEQLPLRSFGPNPGMNVLQLQPGAVSGPVKVWLQAMDGRLLDHWMVDSSGRTVSLSDVPAGTYLLLWQKPGGPILATDKLMISGLR